MKSQPCRSRTATESLFPPKVDKYGNSKRCDISFPGHGRIDNPYLSHSGQSVSLSLDVSWKATARNPIAQSLIVGVE